MIERLEYVMGEDYLDVDFLHISPIYGRKKKSMDYLKDALNIKDVLTTMKIKSIRRECFIITIMG